MNTDNMSICGLTIDYGPFGFMDRLDPDWTPNQTDGLRKRCWGCNHQNEHQFGNERKLVGLSFDT